MPERNAKPYLFRASRDVYRELICGGILAAAFVLFAWLSWRTWPDILVDFGQELYVPWRLTTGDVLYRDVAWVTGPLSQYANALLFRLFGVSLTTVIFANLALVVAIVAMLYALFRLCGTRGSATFIGLFFLAVFAFAQSSVIGNYNYVCPYRHDMTHGLALGLVNLLCLIRCDRTGQDRWLVVSGLCLGLVALLKIEMLLAAFATTAAGLPVLAWRRARSENEARDLSPGAPTLDWRQWMVKTIRAAGIVAATALVPVAIAITALAGPLGWTSSMKNIFLQYRLALAPELSARSGFYRAISGFDQPIENLVELAFVAVVVLSVVVACYVIEWVFGRLKYVTVWATVLSMAIAYCGLLFIPREEWTSIPAALPALLIPVIVFSGRRAVRDADGAATVLFLTAIYGMALLPKIVFRVRWNHYGFVLAMPGTLVLIHVALRTIPAWWTNRGRKGRCFQVVAGGLLAACAVLVVLGWVRIDLAKTAVMGEGADRFYVEPREDGRTIPALNTLAHLRGRLRSDDTLVVIPNGVMLNYLLRARNPTPYIMFSPWESDVHGGDDVIADAFIRAAPDYVVVMTMDLTIHGRGNFGSPEFGSRIRKDLDEHYDVIDHQVSKGGIERGFASTIYMRRGKAE